MGRRPWFSARAAAAIAVLAVAALAAGIATGDDDPARRALAEPVRSHPLPAVRPAAARRRQILIGYSARHRPIRAIFVGDPHATRSVLVVGCIHGNESAGIAVANLLAGANPHDAALWIVPDLNPDGVAADTRQNAEGIDLNRNFPYRWQRLGTRGYLQYSGPRTLSEPEARAVHALILRVRPQITIWFHQPLGLIDLSGGDAAIERQFARYVGLRAVRLTRYPGSAVGWENHALPGTTAFVVELPPGHLSARDTARYAAAIRALAHE